MLGPRVVAWLSDPVVLSVLGNSFCSSLMLVINKMVLRHIPMPSLVSVIQLGFCVVVVACAKSANLISVDNFERSKLVTCFVYVLSFVGGLYSNMRALQSSNVDTVIVFRSCTPLMVCLLDWAFLNRALPNRRSLLALLGLVAGCVGYALYDKDFSVHGLSAYGWVSVYFTLICFNMTYGKYVLSKVVWVSPIWGNVWYTNVLSVVPMACLGVFGQEWKALRSFEMTPSAFAVLLLSCVMGIGLSYTGFHCRNLTSATTYTLVGVVNKLVTVFVDLLIWDEHASPAGLVFLLCCIVASSFYEQAPLQKPKHNEALDEESQVPAFIVNSK